MSRPVAGELADALARAEAAAGEVRSLRSVATRILVEEDLETALSSVTHEALAALEADIAGVFLRDGEQIVMRGCAGNRRRETARLRMHRHQGLAGLVFATGSAARVDDYLGSEVISEDFHDLARAEDVQSALGAPLTLRGEVIGVLEVWRRRRSVFTEVETERLVALAELGAIALNNAQLHDAKAASMQAVERAHRQMEAELRRVQHAMVTQQELVAATLNGDGLAGTLRIAARRADAAAVYLDQEFSPVAAYPVGVDDQAVARAARAVLGALARMPTGAVWATVDERTLVLRAVTAGEEHIGWVGLLAAVPVGDESLELAAAQAGVACSLNHLEEQSAARARAGAREELLIGLLHGSLDDRRAAAARARHLQVDLRGDLRVLCCTFGGLDAVGAVEGWGTVQVDAARRRLAAVAEDALRAEAGLLLATPRGNSFIALCRADPVDAVRATLTGLTAQLRAALPGVRPAWGVSAVHRGPLALLDAHAEAETATRSLRHTPGRSVSCYSDLGILRLLLADPGSADLTRFVAETLGPVVEYDRSNGTALLPTLRAYVEADCSQQDTAAALFVHVKTVKYRLTQVEKLTGLDLASHHDRLRADIAVRTADLFQPRDAEPA